jgi:hypothetical protein
MNYSSSEDVIAAWRGRSPRNAVLCSLKSAGTPFASVFFLPTEQQPTDNEGGCLFTSGHLADWVHNR